MGQEVLDFYDCRMLLEVPCVGLTVPLSDDALVSKLHAVVAEMSVCAAQDRLHDYLLEVARFYELIHERCPNSVLVGVIQSMWRRAMRFRAVAIRAPGRLDDSIAQHSELLEALSVRDRERATTITSAILTGSREAILSELMSRDGRVQSNSPAPIVVKRAPELTERA
jgi:DNA-binding GntR family transcriptional regulator